MAICYFCCQDKDQAEGCIQEFNGQFRFGEELWDRGDLLCSKCGVRRGEFHHPQCEWEECPECHERLHFCIHEYDFRKMPPPAWKFCYCPLCGKDTYFSRNEQGNFICNECKSSEYIKVGGDFNG